MTRGSGKTHELFVKHDHFLLSLSQEVRELDVRSVKILLWNWPQGRISSYRGLLKMNAKKYVKLAVCATCSFLFVMRNLTHLFSKTKKSQFFFFFKRDTLVMKVELCLYRVICNSYPIERAPEHSLDISVVNLSNHHDSWECHSDRVSIDKTWFWSIFFSPLKKYNSDLASLATEPIVCNSQESRGVCFCVSRHMVTLRPISRRDRFLFVMENCVSSLFQLLQTRHGFVWY